jgi:glycosyltransferase involved in cell wall biosynthesis
MVLGIEASNIRAGGGITHLMELLAAFNEKETKFTRIIVWSGTKTLNQLEDKSWLYKYTHPYLNKNIFFRLFWQVFLADRTFKKSGIDVLFVPGSLYFTSFEPLVTMSHNMLPFSPKERDRFGEFYMRYRYHLLEKKHGKAFKTASGVIFLSHFAKGAITKHLNSKIKNSTVIAHGVSPELIKAPKTQKSISEYSEKDPFELLYVSIINVYKHQTTLVKVVYNLIQMGYPIKLTLVGPAYGPELKKLNEIILQLDPKNKFVDYTGDVPYDKINSAYHSADAFVFASTVENLPNILIEAMASGLPIACSNYGPMPEVLQDAGIYFDPENEEEITTSLKKLLNNHDQRQALASKAFNLSKDYSWERCARETFDYLSTFSK